MRSFFLILGLIHVVGGTSSAKSLEEIDSYVKDTNFQTSKDGAGGEYILRTRQGALLVFGSKGPVNSYDQQGAPLFQTLIRRSSDGGWQWSSNYEGPLKDIFYMATESAGGSIFATGVRNGVNGRSFLLKSTDDGLTWSEVVIPIIQKECVSDTFSTVLTRGPQILLSGTCIPRYSLDMPQDYFKHVVLESLDEGLSWHAFSEFGTNLEHSGHPTLVVNSKGDFFTIDSAANIFKAAAADPKSWKNIAHADGNGSWWYDGLFVDRQDVVYEYFQDRSADENFIFQVSADDGGTWKKINFQLYEKPRTGTIKSVIQQIYQGVDDRVYLTVVNVEIEPGNNSTRYTSWSSVYASKDHGQNWVLGYSTRDEPGIENLRVKSMAQAVDGSLILTGTLYFEDYSKSMLKTYRYKE